MKQKNKTAKNISSTAVYDDGNIPDVDLPNGEDLIKSVEPLREAARSCKDVRGGA